MRLYALYPVPEPADHSDTADIEDLKMSNEEMKSEIEKLTKKIAVLERAQSIERNKTFQETSFEM